MRPFLDNFLKLIRKEPPWPPKSRLVSTDLSALHARLKEPSNL